MLISTLAFTLLVVLIFICHDRKHGNLVVDAMVLRVKPYVGSVDREGANRPIVSPSVAKANWLQLGVDLQAAINGGAEWLHFSVQDGSRMVPKLSGLGAPLVEACRTAYPTTILDVKLGCIEPERRIDEFVKAGADILSVHPESTLQVAAVLQQIADKGVAPGIILNPGTSVTTVEPVLDMCQVAVVMLVNPGHGGPKYLDQAVQKIVQLRSRRPEGLHISVDGGVSVKNAGILLEAGADVLVVGGELFAAGVDKRLVIRDLQACAPQRPQHQRPWEARTTL